jgi:hypothetical protein
MSGEFKRQLFNTSSLLVAEITVQSIKLARL